MNNDITTLVSQLGGLLICRNIMVVTAESCTGGGVSKVLTDLPDSGQWFERGFVTYSVEAKKEILGVTQETLDDHGVVSEQTALKMVQGALNKSHAGLGVAITGLAGPDKGPEDKPVGTVCFAWGHGDKFRTYTALFAGDREAVVRQSIYKAVEGLLAMARNAEKIPP